MWQGLARLFGHDLKSEYDAEGEDAAIEHILHAHGLVHARHPEPPLGSLAPIDPIPSTPAVAIPAVSLPRMEKAFILYDLEATCWRTSRPKRVEIIEVGAVKVNENLEIVSEFCAFVRPMMHPVISKFCLPHLYPPIRRRPGTTLRRGHGGV